MAKLFLCSFALLFFNVSFGFAERLTIDAATMDKDQYIMIKASLDEQSGDRESIINNVMHYFGLWSTEESEFDRKREDDQTRLTISKNIDEYKKYDGIDVYYQMIPTGISQYDFDKNWFNIYVPGDMYFNTSYPSGLNGRIRSNFGALIENKCKMRDGNGTDKIKEWNSENKNAIVFGRSNGYLCIVVPVKDSADAEEFRDNHSDGLYMSFRCEATESSSGMLECYGWDVDIFNSDKKIILEIDYDATNEEWVYEWH